MAENEQERRKISEWYNSKMREGGEHSWRPVEAYGRFLDYLGVRPGDNDVAGKSILDVGCGTGYFLRNARDRGLEPYGVDVSEEAVKITKKVVGIENARVCPGEHLCFDDHKFDYVTCLGVLEHFLDIDQGIREMVRVAKDDATLCIMVPNEDFLLWKVTGKPGTAQQDINEQLFSASEWRNKFSQAGLHVIAEHKDTWFGRKSPLHWLAFHLTPFRYTYQMIFIMRKS